MAGRVGVRGGLAGVLTVLAVAALVSELRSQPGPQGDPRFPRPEPVVPRMPTIPQPRFPTPPTVTPGFPYVPPRSTTTGTTTVWECDRCSARLGTGPVKPSFDSCPQCGARFRDTATPASVGTRRSEVSVAAASRTTPVPRPTASRMSTTTTTTADEEEAARVGRTVAVVFGSIFLGFVAFAGGLFTNAVVRSNRAPVRVRSSRVLELD